MERCEDCSAENCIIQDLKEGFYVCEDCGVIQKGYGLMTNVNEWNENGSFIEKQEVGGKETNMCTMASNGKNSKRLNTVKGIVMSDYYQIESRKVQKYFRDICEKYNLSEAVAEKSFSIYQKIYKKTKFNGKKEIHRGRMLEGIKGACLYLSLNELNNVECQVGNGGSSKKTPAELSKMIGIDTKSINSGRKKISLELGIDTKTITHKDLVPKYINNIKKESNCNIPYFLNQKTINYIDIKLKEGCFNNNISKSISAGVLYYILLKQTNLINQNKITLNHIQKSTGVSINTIIKISNSLK